MQPRTLLILTLLVLVLGGFIFFYEKDLPSTDERAERERKVLAIEGDEVQALTIEWQGKKVRLESDRLGKDRPEADDGDSETGGDGAAGEARWRLVEPLQARADRSTVDGLVTTLTGLEKERTLEGMSRAEAGLDEPEVQVTLANADGETVLEVGSEVPASSDRIVAVGSAVYQVSGGFVDDLTREPGEWRDKKLFTAARNEIERVTLTAVDRTVLLAERGEDFWVESPLADRADSDHVSSLLSGITSLTVKSFLYDALLDPTALGLEPPGRIVEAVLEGQEEPFRLELGQPLEGGGNDFYGRAEGQLFEIETGLAEAVDRSAAEWRSRTWTALQVFKIESANLVDAEGALAITREGDDWMRGEDRIDYTAASDLLYAISDAKAEEVMEREEAESGGHRLEDPLLSIDLVTKDGGEELRLYPLTDGVSAATSGGRDAVLLIAADTVEKIQQEVTELRQAESLPEEEAEEAEETAE